MTALQNEVTYEKKSKKQARRRPASVASELQPHFSRIPRIKCHCFLCTVEINQADEAARTAPNYTLKCRKQSKQSEILWGGVKSSQKNKCDESDGRAAVLIHGKQTRGERNSSRQVAVSPVTRHARPSSSRGMRTEGAELGLAPCDKEC
jgi:hypothetical protein